MCGANWGQNGRIWGCCGAIVGQIGAFWGISDNQKVARWLPNGYRKVADFYVICCIAGRNTVAKRSQGIAATKREQKGTNGNKSE